MDDPELQQIDRRIADTLEEIRILRADGHRQWTDAHARDEELFAELRAGRAASEQHAEALFAELRAGRAASEQHADELVAELRALRQVSDLQTEELRHQSQELRRVSDTNQLHTDALRALLERG